MYVFFRNAIVSFVFSVWGFVILDDGAASGYGFPVMVVS